MSDGPSQNPGSQALDQKINAPIEQKKDPREEQNKKLQDLTKKIDTKPSSTELADIKQEIEELLRVAREKQRQYDALNGSGEQHVPNEYISDLEAMLKKTDTISKLDPTTIQAEFIKIQQENNPEVTKKFLETLVGKIGNFKRGESINEMILSITVDLINKLPKPQSAQEASERLGYLNQIDGYLDPSMSADIPEKLAQGRAHYEQIISQLGWGNDIKKDETSFSQEKFKNDPTYQIASIKQITDFENLHPDYQKNLLIALTTLDIENIILQEGQVTDELRSSIETIVSSESAFAHTIQANDDLLSLGEQLKQTYLKSYNKLSEQNTDRLHIWEERVDRSNPTELAHISQKYESIIHEIVQTLGIDSKFVPELKNLDSKISTELQIHNIGVQDTELLKSAVIQGAIKEQKSLLALRQGAMQLNAQKGVISYTEKFTGYTTIGEASSYHQGDLKHTDDTKSNNVSTQSESSHSLLTDIATLPVGTTIEINGSQIKKLTDTEYRVDETKARNPEQVQTLVEFNSTCNKLGIGSLSGRPETLDLIRTALTTLRSHNTQNIPHFDAPNFQEFADDFALILLETISVGDTDNNQSINDRSLILSRSLKSQAPQGDRQYLIGSGLIRQDGSINIARFQEGLTEKLREGYKPKFRENENNNVSKEASV